MSETTKIAVVGAGSAFFGPQALVGLLRRDELRGARLALHDIDQQAVERMERLASLLIAEGGGDRQVQAGTDLAACLDGADFVILSVAVDREATWQRDRAFAQAHGIEHYAENGGPAAIAHTGRNLALLLPIAREMERRCPQAWLLNYVNPVARLCTALDRYTSVRTLGVCHQIDFGYFMIGALLGDDLDIQRPSDCRFRWTDERLALSAELAQRARERVRVTAAGLNHFTWVTALTARDDGRDLLPLLRQRCQEYDEGFEPLSRKVLELLGSFPVPGDCHLAEYLPFTHSPARETWQRYEVQMYDLAWSERQRRLRAELVERIVDSGDTSLTEAFVSERAEDLIIALQSGQGETDEALNLPNRTAPGGAPAIKNLPADAVVEAPARFGPDGPELTFGAPLPAAVAELCRRQIAITELCVAGLYEGDRDKLLQALALDPMIDDPELPAVLLDEYLRTSERYLAPLRGS